jgi:hypothetical protein
MEILWKMPPSAVKIAIIPAENPWHDITVSI